MLRIISQIMLATVIVMQAPVLKAQQANLSIETKRFQKFMGFIGNKLTDFQSQNLPNVKSVFYPFGGPDLLYPILLFPNAERYALIGLETAGHPLSESNLAQTQKQIDPFLRRGFFVTSSMSGTYNKKSGVRAALALQILLLGGEIISDELTDDGVVTITFKMNGAEKTVYYLRRDLTANTDEVFSFLKRVGISDLCMLKSSSYALHNKIFSTFRDGIINHFSYLLQDDTGVPFQFIANNKNKYFGRYKSPYGQEFRGYLQSRLVKVYQQNQNEIPEINFCYGYGCGRVQANFLLSELQGKKQLD